jgi:amidase
MTDDDLCFLTATEAVGLFKRRRLSPVDVMSAIIRRCERVNPKLNALTYTFFERAMAAARGAETRYAMTDGRLRPLEGVPLTVKDDHDVEGEITTHGSRIFADKVSTGTVVAVARLLRAGAIMHARTTTPEFAAASICYSPLWGVTRNPWNRRYSPGGSTGGGGAAVAAGMTVLSDGADYAGSVRTPASCCGVFGFKPPRGRIPTVPPWNFNGFSSFGPITRSVADGTLMTNVMAGAHGSDVTALPRPRRLTPPFGPIKGWRVAYSVDLGYCEVHPDVRRNTLAAVEAFRGLGCTVEEANPGWTWRTREAWLANHVAFIEADPDAFVPRHKRHLLSDYIQGYARMRPTRHSLTFGQGVAYRAEMWRRLGPILERNHVFLCPTLAVPAVPATLSPVAKEFRINGKPIDPGLGWLMTYPFNALPTLPVASVPSGFARTGVPTGLQIVGRPYDDASVFRAAAAFETARPWRGARPRL